MKRMALAALLIGALGVISWLQRGERTETATVDVSPTKIGTQDLFEQRDLVPIESGPVDPGQVRREVEPEMVAPESGGPLSATNAPPTRTAPGEYERVQQELYDLRRRLALKELKRIHDSIRLYARYNYARYNDGVYPNSFEQLLSLTPDGYRFQDFESGFLFWDESEGRPKDPWGTHYQFHGTGEALRIVSLGADGAHGGAGFHVDIRWPAVAAQDGD